VNTAFLQRASFARWLGQSRSVIVVLAMLLLQACSVELYTGLDQRQANEIVATLVRHGIPAQRRADNDGAMTVTVGKGRFADAMAVLEDAGLPKTEYKSLGDVFQRDGLVSSPVEERAAMVYGLSQELSRTIADIDGVLSARVHLVLPDNDPLRRELVPSSASVFIRHRASAQMGDYVPQVKMLVANGVAGLAYDNVSVVLVPAQGVSDSAIDNAKFATFLGMWMHPDSVARAQFLIYGLGFLVLCLAGGLGFEHWRQRRSVYTLPVRAKKT